MGRLLAAATEAAALQSSVFVNFRSYPPGPFDDEVPLGSWSISSRRGWTMGYSGETAGIGDTTGSALVGGVTATVGAEAAPAKGNCLRGIFRRNGISRRCNPHCGAQNDQSHDKGSPGCKSSFPAFLKRHLLMRQRMSLKGDRYVAELLPLCDWQKKSGRQDREPELSASSTNILSRPHGSIRR